MAKTGDCLTGPGPGGSPEIRTWNGTKQIWFFDVYIFVYEIRIKCQENAYFVEFSFYIAPFLTKI